MRFQGVPLRQNGLDGISGGNVSSSSDAGKDPFSGHDTVSRLMVNGAALMALLADLRDFEKGILSDFEDGSEGEGTEVDATGREVFGEVPRTDIESGGSHLLHAFDG